MGPAIEIVDTAVDVLGTVVVLVIPAVVDFCTAVEVSPAEVVRSTLVLFGPAVVDVPAVVALVPTIGVVGSAVGVVVVGSSEVVVVGPVAFVFR